jgi:hypothetical protein
MFANASRAHLENIGTVALDNGLRSDRVLNEVRPEFIDVGFDVEIKHTVLLRPYSATTGSISRIACC